MPAVAVVAVAAAAAASASGSSEEHSLSPAGRQGWLDWGWQDSKSRMEPGPVRWRVGSSQESGVLVHKVTKVSSLVPLLQGDRQTPAALGKDFTLAFSSPLSSDCCPLSFYFSRPEWMRRRTQHPPIQT